MMAGHELFFLIPEMGLMIKLIFCFTGCSLYAVNEYFDHLTDTDSLSTVVVYQDVYAQKQVYLSEIKDFTSDYSAGNLSLELKRLAIVAL